MSILQYLLENLFVEGRWDITKPQHFEFWYSDGSESYHPSKNGTIISSDGEYELDNINNNSYVVSFEESHKYNNISNELGTVSLSPKHGFLISTPNISSIEATDENIKNNEELLHFFNTIDDIICDVYIDDFSFKLSQEDSDYDPDDIYKTINTGNASSVFNVLNNLSYIMINYTQNYKENVIFNTGEIDSDYGMIFSKIKYYLNSIEFIAKSDFKGDMRRFNIYKAWFKTLAPKIGNVVKISYENNTIITTFTETQLS